MMKLIITILSFVFNVTAINFSFCMDEKDIPKDILEQMRIEQDIVNKHAEKNGVAIENKLGMELEKIVNFHIDPGFLHNGSTVLVKNCDISQDEEILVGTMTGNGRKSDNVETSKENSIFVANKLDKNLNIIAAYSGNEIDFISKPVISPDNKKISWIIHPINTNLRKEEYLNLKVSGKLTGSKIVIYDVLTKNIAEMYNEITFNDMRWQSNDSILCLGTDYRKAYSENSGTQSIYKIHINKSEAQYIFNDKQEYSQIKFIDSESGKIYFCIVYPSEYARVGNKRTVSSLHETKKFSIISVDSQNAMKDEFTLDFLDDSTILSVNPVCLSPNAEFLACEYTGRGDLFNRILLFNINDNNIRKMEDKVFTHLVEWSKNGPYIYVLQTQKENHINDSANTLSLISVSNP